MHVTADCVDPTYANPVIDAMTDETSPVPHHRVAGHFEGTDIQFTIYLHAEADKVKWEGRFFQYTYPTVFTPGVNLAEATDRAIGFALASGGYAVQAGNTSLSLGYRHAAAAAKFAETVAADYYSSDEPIYGYLYGPSGGSFQTVGAAENTDGVWQGFVPMVQAVPTPNSYNFNGRAAAELILADKADLIRDALMPGGSGDPHAVLDEAESALYEEVAKLGIPVKAWENPEYLFGYDEQFYGTGGLSSDDPLSYDPTYVDDFWNSPGYLGTEDSPLGERVRAALLEMGDSVGHRWNIAKRFAYRYQLPADGTGWIALDQFRNPDGSPIHPQRAVGEPGFSGFVSGFAAFDGSVNGKVIAVSNLYDTDALPIHTDWYRQRIEESLGAATSDNYRLYFTDHADHQDAVPSGERATYAVDWYGIVEQALRDIATWAEGGAAAPASTRYTIEDAQIVISDKAHERDGLQPSVDITTGGGQIITAKVGQAVPIVATARAPRGGGLIITAEWDFDGDGTYDARGVASAKKNATVSTKHVFSEPGTYFVSVKVAAERNGDVDAEYALLQNIDRVRVVVTE
ncbi:PKD domain-containing protein [Agromyces mangrovi Wang et al. 2018]|uniref:PKD domain-containing protein n=1 Tax=Agromyces mangrovi TaxID=1858653 RepID=UPI0025734E9C|nr:PKD domain-containing protein [Agromyces mangrovi]